jgi:hypothetical protein
MVAFKVVIPFRRPGRSRGFTRGPDEISVWQQFYMIAIRTIVNCYGV